MKFAPRFNLSLHNKLVIITWLMVFYLVLQFCGVASFIVVAYVKSDLERKDEVAEYRSQTATHISANVFHVINITGSRLIERGTRTSDNINDVIDDIDLAFLSIRSIADQGLNNDLVDTALQSWQQVKDTCTSIVAVSITQHGVVTPNIMKQYLALNDSGRTLEVTLQQIRNLSQNESKDIENRLNVLNGVVIPFIMMLYITALAINTIAVVMIIRSVVMPAHVIARAAHSYARGSLSYRIPVSASNEIGELAGTFNYMAEQLESSYTALKDLAIHDGLTGTLNQHEFQKRLLWEVKRAGRYKRNLSLVMLDIDHFKRFNDTYGHQAGDKVLKSVGRYLSNAIRASDEAARYGGEEFALIMPETSPETAYITAQRIGEEIANLKIAVDENVAVSVTVSIGVATYPRDAATNEELIAAADCKLYDAKQSGRNCVCASLK